MRTRVLTILALALAVGLATAASPFASASPDGLEKVGADKRFAEQGRDRKAPIAGYAFPGVEDERLATGLAGFAGTLGVFAIGYALAFALRRRDRVRPGARRGPGGPTPGGRGGPTTRAAA